LGGQGGVESVADEGLGEFFLFGVGEAGKFVFFDRGLRGVPVVVVTSVGFKSGKLRKNPVMRIKHDGAYLAVASQGGAPTHPSWYYNLSAQPLVELQDGPVKGDYVARELSGDERALWWDRAVEVWPDYAEYQTGTQRQIPLFVLEPAA
jgi:deazaflavin-dependent oxidoreductase (nitroreductase family)